MLLRKIRFFSSGIHFQSCEAHEIADKTNSTAASQNSLIARIVKPPRKSTPNHAHLWACSQVQRGPRKTKLPTIRKAFSTAFNTTVPCSFCTLSHMPITLISEMLSLHHPLLQLDNRERQFVFAYSSPFGYNACHGLSTGDELYAARGSAEGD